MSRPAGELVVVGLGPGAPEQLTEQARRWLAGGWPVLLRTRRHPLVAAWPAAAAWPSLDDLYDTATDFTALATAMLERLAEQLATVDRLIYAVPGHPLFGEASVLAARAAGWRLRLVPGLSPVDLAAGLLGRDPVAEGWQLLDALTLAELGEREPFAGGQLTYTPLRPALILQLAGRRLASAVKLTLMRLLPDTYPVTLLEMAGQAGQERQWTLPLHALDRADDRVDHLISLYVPAQAPLAALRLPQTLTAITARLRAPGGCPWDREQTHQSLVAYIIEESYEVVEAIEAGDTVALCEELGDLLLQVALHAQLAEEAGTFLLEDVIEAINAKLIRRHPHVFGAAEAADGAAVLRNWEQIKAAERQAKGPAEPVAASPFAGLPRALPALSRAATIQRRAAQFGYQSPPPAALVERLTAAATALTAAPADQPAPVLADRLGELLLAAVELAGRHQLDPEAALRLASERFRRRQEAAVAAEPA